VELEQLRLTVYQTFAERGRPPTVGELAERFTVSPDDVRAGLDQLAAARHMALDADGAVTMAHPFSAVPLGFSVMGADTLWWGGCAWDSFALPSLLQLDDVLVATRCPACERPHAWNVGRGGPPPGNQVAHFLVPAARMWDDVVFTCCHQRIFCSPVCVDRWLGQTGHRKGCVLDLGVLWRLAAHWYDGRLEAGYVRREPSAAAAYLRSVGLTGAFWGL
jgi:hypothetical protein